MNNQNCLSLQFKGKGPHRLILLFIIITVTGQQHVSPRVLIILTLSASQRSAHYRFCDLQEHRTVEQSPLHHFADDLGSWEHISSDWLDLTSCVLIEAVLQRIVLLLSDTCLTHTVLSRIFTLLFLLPDKYISFELF